MSYSAQTVSSYTQEEFDALWNDCANEIVGKTMPIADVTECKSTVFSVMNQQPFKLKISKDNKDISYITGSIKENNHFFILSGVHGNDSTGSRAWLYDTNYWAKVKEILVANNAIAYAGEMIKNESAYNQLLKVDSLNLYPDSTFSTSNEVVVPNLFTKIDICFLHD